MRTFSEYILEARQNYIFGGTDDRNVSPDYKYTPKSNEELRELMKKLIKERGNEGDFSDIDTSNVTSMRCIFWWTIHFNGNISTWDTSQVTNMDGMFYHAEKFNRDISAWDTSSVTTMDCMFYNAKSFNQDISSLDVSKVTNTDGMFHKCPIKEEYKPKFKI